MPFIRAAQNGSHPRDRSRARAWALQVLYRWESAGGGETILQALTKVLRTRTVSVKRVAYLELLLETLQDHLPEVDKILQDSLENWRLDRLSVMDRSILRISGTELLYLAEVVFELANLPAQSRLSDVARSGRPAESFQLHHIPIQ